MMDHGTTADFPSTTRPTKPQPAPKKIECRDPATGEILGEVTPATIAEIHDRVARAKTAAASWQRTAFAERRRVLSLMLEALLGAADELCEVICRDSGKTRENAMLGEIWPVAEKLRWTIRNGERFLQPERMPSGILAHKVATIEYQPLGVIANICPWNFPLQNILGPVIPALMAGNACIVKVSEWTSWSARPFSEFIDRVLRAAGHSTDLVQIVTGGPEVGAALIRDGVDKVVFTGSAVNGRKVIEESARNCTPVILELGGKDPMIVCDDANLDQAVHTALAGAFLTSGQMCMATERIYVFDAVHDVFVDKVVELAAQLTQGPPLGPTPVDVGAMTMPGQIDIVENLVADAVTKGACVRVGGTRRAGGQFYAPTVLTDVDHSMKIMREETFGPVLAIARVRDEAHAIELANDTAYGLSSSVFTRSRKRAARIARQIRAGSTIVNDFGLGYMAQALPFGGVGGSGYGRLNGREGLRACTNIKAIVSDRFPLHRPVKLFPVRKGDYELTKGLIRLVYEQTWPRRVQAVVELSKTLIERARSR